MSRAVVTGASRGIGRAVTERLLADGWHVAGLSRTDPGLEHARFWWVEHDLADADASRWELPFLLGRAPVDALVHCAAVRGPCGPFLENDPEAWAATIATNLLGTQRILRATLPLLRQAEDGRILLFSGGGAFGPEPGYSAYACTKGATVALMETLAAELAGTSVSVNAVAPGFIATHIHDGTPLAGVAGRDGALGRVVACVCHLLAPATRGLTGKTVAAQWDDVRAITQRTVGALNDSRMGTRERSKIQRLDEYAHHAPAHRVPAGMR